MSADRYFRVTGGKHLEYVPIEKFWQGMAKLAEYRDLGNLMLLVMALPQSTAAVERSFSKVTLN